MGKHIVLIGFMGSGKTCVSRLLAARLDRRLVDTDEQLVQEQEMTISEIFEKKGEAAFRRMEHALLLRLAACDTPLVISTGGGLAAQPENKEALLSLGTVVYLQVCPQTVFSRLANDTTRPLLAGDDKEKKIEALLAARAPLYEEAATITVETDALSPQEIVEQIVHLQDLKEEFA